MRTLIVLLASLSILRASVYFDGTGTTYLTAINKGRSLDTNALTLSLHTYPVVGFNAFSVSLGGDGYNPTPYNFQNRAVAGSPHMVLYYISDGLNDQIYDSGLGPYPNLSACYSLTLIYGTSSSMQWYKDGLLISGSWTAGGSAVCVKTAHDIHYGNYGDDFVAQRSWNGFLSEVAVYNTNLTTIELLNLNKSKMKRIALQIRPANLAYYWPLDQNFEGSTDNTANRLFDLSGNKLPATAVGPCRYAAEHVCSYPPNE